MGGSPNLWEGHGAYPPPVKVAEDKTMLSEVTSALFQFFHHELEIITGEIRRVFYPRDVRYQNCSAC